MAAASLLLAVATAFAACGARNDLPIGSGDYGGPDDEGGSGDDPPVPVCGTVEGCNGVDDDCDGVVDEDCVEGERIGCADGQREGFVDVAAHPDIAGCSGGFEQGALAGEAAPRCGRISGDDGTNPSGRGCSAEDLCAEGWSVCPSEAEVARLAGSCADAAPEPGLFFASRQSGPGCGICATGTITDQTSCDCSCTEGCAPNPWTTNDVFGCGTIGDTTQRCGVLDRFSNDLCGFLGQPWTCFGNAPDGGTASCREAAVVRKDGPAGGGVLCCRAAR